MAANPKVAAFVAGVKSGAVKVGDLKGAPQQGPYSAPSFEKGQSITFESLSGDTINGVVVSAAASGDPRWGKMAYVYMVKGPAGKIYKTVKRPGGNTLKESA